MFLRPGLPVRWNRFPGAGGFAVVGAAALGVPEHGERLHDAIKFRRYGFTRSNIGVVPAHEGAVGAGDFP
jgi:hypothetical protein